MVVFSEPVINLLWGAANGHKGQLPVNLARREARHYEGSSVQNRIYSECIRCSDVPDFVSIVPVLDITPGVPTPLLNVSVKKERKEE